MFKSIAEQYFVAEKQESVVFLVVGIVALALALAGWLWWKTPITKGAAWPLLLIGCIQIAVGYTIYTRSDKDRVRVVYAADMDPQQLQQEELPRMQKVMRDFQLYKWIEIALLGVAVVLLGVVTQIRLTAMQADFWKGLAIALAIQCLIMLIADIIAAARGKQYVQALQQWLEQLNG